MGNMVQSARETYSLMRDDFYFMYENGLVDLVPRWNWRPYAKRANPSLYVDRFLHWMIDDLEESSLHEPWGTWEYVYVDVDLI
jgi:hypothetical protein